MRIGETRVHIPNTTVKTDTAESTKPARAWEARRLPDPLKNKIRKDLTNKDRMPAIRVLKRFRIRMAGMTGGDEKRSQNRTLKTSYREK